MNDVAEPNATTGPVWAVTRNGQPHSLRISTEGISLGGPEPQAWPWVDIASVEFPTSFSREIVSSSGAVVALGFTGRESQAAFRTALQTQTRELEGDVVDLLTTSAPGARPKPVTLVMMHHVHNRVVVEQFGLISTHTVMSRNAISDFGSDIKNAFGGQLQGMETAIERGLKTTQERLQQHAASRLGADAVVDVSVSIESVSDKAQSVFMTGTAVRTEPAPLGSTASSDV